MSNNEDNKHSPDPASSASGSDSHGEHVHAITPLSLYYKVFIGLIGLTFLTVLTSMFDFGVMNILIAMLIAVIKASLVVLFFMQLKVDNLENKVTLMAAFAFLFIFIALTGSDLFFRHHLEAMKVETPVLGVSIDDQNRLRVATPEMVTKGKEIYQNQCASCHGVEGKGDGVASGGLNPPPRNFTTGYWRYGGTPTQIFHTLTNGSPGTMMASFANLSVEDRYALVHYVRSLSPKHPDDDAKTLAAAGLSGNVSPEVALANKPKESIPIDIAMDKIEVPDQVILPVDEEIDPNSTGAKLFKRDCASCHGLNGVGAVIMALGQNPHVDYMTRSFNELKFDQKTHLPRPWVSNQNEFILATGTGNPGRAIPGRETYSSQDWAELYSYMKKLTSEP